MHPPDMAQTDHGQHFDIVVCLRRLKLAIAKNLSGRFINDSQERIGQEDHHRYLHRKFDSLLDTFEDLDG